MKKIILILLILLDISYLQAIEPVTYVPSLPANLEAFTDNEEIFFNKVMDYYIPAILLKNQLDLLNIKTNINIPPLSFEMLSNMETKDIQKYYNDASKLYKKVQETELNIVDQNLFRCEKEKNELKKQLIKLSLDTIASNKNQEIYELLQLSLDSSLQKSKDIEKKLWKKIQKLNEEFNEYKLNSLYIGNQQPSFDIKFELFTEQNFFNDERINSKLSPGIGLTMQLIKLTKKSSKVNLWGKYNLLTNEISAPSQKPPQVNAIVKNHINVWSTGADLQISLSDFFYINKVVWNFNIGAGYFSCYSKYYNTSIPENDFAGYEIKMETSLGRFSTSFPFKLVFGTNFKKFSDELIFSSINNTINLGKPWISSIYAGIQFDFVKLY